MTDTPETDKCVKQNKHLKLLQEDVWVNDNKITYENPIVFLCQKLERERDRLAEALRECREDSVELLGERDWWQNEPRCDYDKRYQEICDNVTRADAALQSLTNNQND